MEPWTGKVGEFPIAESGPVRTSEVSAPGARVIVPALNTSGLPAAAAPPLGDDRVHPVGDDVMAHGALHAGAVDVPVLVPAKVTRHVAAVHVIVLVPVFLIVIAKATGLAVDVDPPVNRTEVTWMEELAVAEPARP